MKESLDDKLDAIRFLLYVIIGELATIAIYIVFGGAK